jgi:hypothetical protein
VSYNKKSVVCLWHRPGCLLTCLYLGELTCYTFIHSEDVLYLFLFTKFVDINVCLGMFFNKGTVMMAVLHWQICLDGKLVGKEICRKLVHYIHLWGRMSCLI